MRWKLGPQYGKWRQWILKRWYPVGGMQALEDLPPEGTAGILE
jgi:hypothetical protein